MPRVFVILFSFWILVLSLMPCTDELCLTDHDDKKTAQHDGGEEHHEDIPCSPFCSWSCCGISVALLPSFSFSYTATALFFKIDFPKLKTLKWENPPQIIWQPPKLV